MIFMRFPEGRAKALTFSYDDNVRENIRLIQIFNRYGMKATFNINSGLYPQDDSHLRMMSKDEMTKLFDENSPHEVAIHSHTHPFLAALPIVAATEELLCDRQCLEEQFHRIVRGMAYPNNSYNDEIVSAARSCGIVYARTTDSTERFDLPTDWLRMPTTCHHNSPRLMELATSFVEKEAKYLPKLFYLWGHSYEFEDNQNWEIIERFTSYMGGREAEIWYATNIEIYEYVEAYHRLIFSADCKTVKNPTSITLWFSYNKQLISILPNQTLNL
ncbi:MAG: polysaccharide deacetylase [Ruminococcaceae bacterium]|nr:polysaccharide deacetylase [Oscillospiraceae bacterium]